MADPTTKAKEKRQVYPVYDWLDYHAKNIPDAVALIDHHSDRVLPYSLLNERCNRAANYLQELGVAPKDRVAVLAHNTSDTMELLFACQKLGAIFVPLNWRLAKPELEVILDDCRPSVIFHGGEFENTAGTLAASFGIPAVSFGEGGENDYEQGLRAASSHRDFHPQTHDDIWIIMYTSGTTGTPKGACLTHGNVLFSSINQSLKFTLTRHSRCLTALPLFHVGGLFIFATFLMHLGGSAVIVRQFEPSACLGLLSDPDLCITDVFGVPTIFLFMSQLPEFADADLSRLDRVLVGGAPAPRDLLEIYAAKGVRIGQAFGMTETATTGTALGTYMPEKLGSSGLPSLHTQLRVVDTEGRDVPRGEIGELWIKGPAISPGYWNRPETNNAAFTDGWFHTGDAVTEDEEGYFYIVDRWKDMFISGGENVYPAEIENALHQLTQVAEAAVIGVDDPRWGEVGCAYIALKGGESLTEQAVIDHCRTNLAGFKVPKHVRFITDIPHNAAGKILKQDLRRHYQDHQ